MAKLSDIANVVIELRTASIAKANFGIPMIAAVSSVLKNRAEVFYDLNSVLEYTNGGQKLEQTIVDAVRVAFSQTPRIDRVVVGKLLGTNTPTATVDQTTLVNGEAPDATDYIVTVNGTAITYTTPASGGAKDKLPDIVNGLVTKLTANQTLNSAYTFTPDTVAGTVTFTPKSSATADAVLVGGTGVKVSQKGDLSSPLAGQLSEIQGFNSSWYGFALAGLDDDDTLAAAAWAEAADPVVQFWAASTSPEVWDPASSSDILSTLRDNSYLRTVMIPTKSPAKLEPVAEMARFYVGLPGQIVAGLKSLAAVTPTAWTATESKAILDKNGNTYEKYASNTFLLNPGKAVSGEWADVVRDRDWLINDIQTAMASALIRNPKIPYTNQGITILVNVLNGRLRNAQKQGVIAPDQIDELGNTVPGFYITAPNALNVDPDTKAARKLELSFVALLAGAIQMVDVRGVLTYSYEG